MNMHFESWWEREGKSFDPDTSDVPWEDKRKALAEKAFDVAMAISQNYTADDSTFPSRVTFANGREVSISDNFGSEDPYLSIS